LNEKGVLVKNAEPLNHTNSFVNWWMLRILKTCLIGGTAFLDSAYFFHGFRRFFCLFV
jgi:hypothetical protein